MATKTITSADTNIGIVVRALIAAKRVTVGEVADALKVDPATVHGKMNGRRGWRADEVQVLANYFGVAVGTFYGGLAALGISDGYWPPPNTTGSHGFHQESLLDALAVTAA